MRWLAVFYRTKNLNGRERAVGTNATSNQYTTVEQARCSVQITRLAHAPCRSPNVGC